MHLCVVILVLARMSDVLVRNYTCALYVKLYSRFVYNCICALYITVLECLLSGTLTWGTRILGFYTQLYLCLRYSGTYT
jgi:hypothetical protein